MFILLSTVQLSLSLRLFTFLPCGDLNFLFFIFFFVVYVIILKAFWPDFIVQRTEMITKQENLVHFSSSFVLGYIFILLYINVFLLVCRRVVERVVTGLIAPRLLRDGPISCIEQESNRVDTQKSKKKKKKKERRKPQGLNFPPIKKESWLEATGFYIPLQCSRSLSLSLFLSWMY